ncbi:hypothetical protein IAT38_000437 [Cryptococcus sp. DSM 104549]
MASSSSQTPSDSLGSTSRKKTLEHDDGKKRKIQRACDACRKKKIKCDGPQNSLSTSRCLYCQELGLECTYVESTSRRGPPKGYVESLEQKCGRLERLLNQLQPNVDVTQYVGPALNRDEFDINHYRKALHFLQIPPYPGMKPLNISTQSPITRVTPGSSASSSSSPSAGIPFPPMHESASPQRDYERDPDLPEDTEELEEAAELHVGIAEGMSKLEMTDWNWRYHGKAADAHLIRKFYELKAQVPGPQRNVFDGVNRRKRGQYWDDTEWEMMVAEEQLRPIDYANWPDRGLDQKLIDAFFDRQNALMPLLNRRLFQRQFDAGLWETSHGFAKVCLAVFAIGAKYVDDRRVCWSAELSGTKEGRDRLAGYKESMLRHSAGWRYVRAVLRMGRSVMHGPTVHDLQTQALLCTFLMVSASPHLVWAVADLGLRSSQEIGIHMRAAQLHADPSERALLNRAFWYLYHFDRVSSVVAGRAVGLYDSDFDVDYPVDVDDEYWDTGDPERDFKQPEGRGPSRVAAFIQTLKLDRIISAALRTIYSLNRLTEERADPSAQRAIVVKLDLALNTWADNVPHELRWDPDRGDYIAFQQSALLYVHYYYCQILVHRQYIPTPSRPDTGLPALAICANAARSTCSIFDACLRRARRPSPKSTPQFGSKLPPNFAYPAWITAIIHLVSIFSGQQTAEEREVALKGLETCKLVLRELEPTFRQVGKTSDFLAEMVDLEVMPPVGAWRQAEKRGHADVAQEGEAAGSSQQADASTSAAQLDYLPPSSGGTFPSYPTQQPNPTTFDPFPPFDSNFQPPPPVQPLYLPNHFQVPMSSDEQLRLFNSLMGINTFESQFVDMSAVAPGAGEGTGQGQGQGQAQGADVGAGAEQGVGGGAAVQEGQMENDWWAQLFSDYM